MLHVPAHFQTAVVHPLDSEMAVVKGLVTAGIFSHTFHASKKARRGYYIPIPEVYVPNLHPSQYIFVGLDGLSYCQNSITTIINKGQVLGPDELFQIKITKLIIPGDALEFEDSLWASDDEMPPGQKVYSNCHPGSLPPRRFHLYSETREQRQMPAFTELAKITTILRDKRPDIDFRKFRTLTGSVWYKVDYEILFTFSTELRAQSYFEGQPVSALIEYI